MWPEDEESQAQIKEDWHPRFGDRFQKLIFIGKPEILGTIRTSLEKCLLTDDELAEGSEYWQQVEDPFGDWNQYVPTSEADEAE